MTSLLLSVRHVLRCKVPAIKVNLRHASSLPYAIKPSQVEIGQRSLDSRSLELAIRHLHHDGLVVIEDVVPHEGIEKLNNKMVEDALTLQARGKDGPFNYNQGNLQQDAPPLKEHFSPSIFASRSVISRCWVKIDMIQTHSQLKSLLQCLGLDQN